MKTDYDLMAEPNLLGRPLDLSWLRAPVLQDVLSLLALDNGAARLVGGCVRDFLLGHPSETADIDIATTHHPNQVMALAKSKGLSVIPTGIGHGTVTLKMAGRFFEVTSLRQDVSTDGRRACVAYTTDFSKDAGRRDFTINALYLDKMGRLYDYVGGLQDLKNRRLIFVGDAATRLEEDTLRLLRFFRLSAQLNIFEYDAQGLAACCAYQEKIGRLSGERIWQELRKLLASIKPQHVLETMVTHGILSRCFAGRGSDKEILSALPHYQDIDQLNWRDPELRLMGILRNFTPQSVVKIATNLALSNKLRGRLLAQNHWAEIAKAPRHVALYWYGAQAVGDWLQLHDPARWQRDLVKLRSYKKPIFPLSGKVVMAKTGRQGPDLGKCLLKLEHRWVNSHFTLDQDALLKEV